VLPQAVVHKSSFTQHFPRARVHEQLGSLFDLFSRSADHTQVAIGELENLPLEGEQYDG
jgi:hypothetical protein